jgi:hypothetical protein
MQLNWLTTSITCILIIVSGWSFTVISSLSTQRIASVNLDELTRPYILALASSDLSEAKITEETQILIDKIEDAITLYSAKNDLVIIPTQAPIYGAVDVTQEISIRLERSP